MTPKYNVLVAVSELIIRRILDNRNHLIQNVFFVVNILETIQIIKDYNIDIAILDLDIPDAEAFKILRHLEIHSKFDTEIVILNHQNESYYLQNKKIKIIHKPLNIFELKNLIITTTHILEARNNTN